MIKSIEIENISSEVIKKYIEDMLFGNYEGFEKNDIEGIEKMLEDMVLYNKNR